MVDGDLQRPVTEESGSYPTSTWEGGCPHLPDSLKHAPVSEDAVQGAQDVGGMYAVVVGIVSITLFNLAQEASKPDLAKGVPTRGVINRRA